MENFWWETVAERMGHGSNPRVEGAGVGEVVSDLSENLPQLESKAAPGDFLKQLCWWLSMAL